MVYVCYEFHLTDAQPLLAHLGSNTVSHTLSYLAAPYEIANIRAVASKIGNNR